MVLIGSRSTFRLWPNIYLHCALSIKGHPSKTSGRGICARGICGGVSAKVDDLGQEGGVGHQPDVQKKKLARKNIFLVRNTFFARFFFGVVSVVRIGVRHPPTPPPPWIPICFGVDRNIFCISDVFTFYTVRTSEMGVGGGCLPNERCWTGWGSKKSIFGSDVFDGWPLISINSKIIHI